MNDPWIPTAEALAAILAAENAALKTLDLRGAIALLDAKNARITAFHAGRPQPESRSMAVDLLEHLALLAEANRHLLDRAIKAQGKVIGILAEVVRQTPPAPRYGSKGALRDDRPVLTMTLSARV